MHWLGITVIFHSARAELLSSVAKRPKFPVVAQLEKACVSSGTGDDRKAVPVPACVRPRPGRRCRRSHETCGTGCGPSRDFRKISGLGPFPWRNPHGSARRSGSLGRTVVVAPDRHLVRSVPVPVLDAPVAAVDKAPPVVVVGIVGIGLVNHAIGLSSCHCWAVQVPLSVHHSHFCPAKNTSSSPLPSFIIA